MKFSTKLLSAAVLMAFSSATFAAGIQDTTDIQINVTKDEYVNLLGTALTTFAVNSFSEAQVNAGSPSLGTLGAEANNGGGCGIAFTSANGFRLSDGAAIPTFLHGAGVYAVNHATDYSTD